MYKETKYPEFEDNDDLSSLLMEMPPKCPKCKQGCLLKPGLRLVSPEFWNTQVVVFLEHILISTCCDREVGYFREKVFEDVPKAHRLTYELAFFLPAGVDRKEHYFQANVSSQKSVMEVPVDGSEGTRVITASFTVCVSLARFACFSACEICNDAHANSVNIQPLFSLPYKTSVMEFEFWKTVKYKNRKKKEPRRQATRSAMGKKEQRP